MQAIPLTAPFAVYSDVHGNPRAAERMAEDYPYRAILFGHTHVAYAREVAHGDAGASTLFVNVGSGGRPKDGDWRVCYAVVDPVALAAGSPAEAEPAAGTPAGAEPAAGTRAVELVRVPYDHERLLDALARTDLITSFRAPSAGAVRRPPDRSRP